MATHDYVIANASGSSVRSDINNALAAIVSNNSSSSEPSTKYAYMLWADTTNGVLKIRNSANNAWIELLQLDGTLTMEDGAEATPGLAFRDDLNTGIWSSAADTFNISTGGTERLELGTTTVFNESGADVDFRIEGDTEANLFYVDAGNDRIGIGTGSPEQLLHLSSTGTPRLRISDADGTNQHLDLFQAGGSTYLDTRNANSHGNIVLRSYDGTDSLTRLKIDTNGNVGIGTTSPSKPLHMYGGASDAEMRLQTNSGTEHNAFIALRNSGGHVDIYSVNSAINLHPANQKRLEVLANGNVEITDGDLVIGTAGHGIDFSAQTASSTASAVHSEVLDHYEEGAFTANYKTGSGGGNTLSAASYTTTGGLYTKIGDIVHFQIRLKCTSATTVGGQIVIQGLPFTQTSTSILSGAYIVASEMLSASNNARLIIDGTEIKFQTLAGGALASGAGGLDFTGEFHCAGWYKAA